MNRRKRAFLNAAGQSIRKQLEREGYDKPPPEEQILAANARAAQLPVTPRDHLTGKTLRFIGFHYSDHEYRTGYFLQMCVYKILDVQPVELVIAISEGPLPANVEGTRAALGLEVAGEKVAPYAARQAQVELPKFRQAIEQAMSGWVWDPREFSETGGPDAVQNQGSADRHDTDCDCSS